MCFADPSFHFSQVQLNQQVNNSTNAYSFEGIAHTIYFSVQIITAPKFVLLRPVFCRDPHERCLSFGALDRRRTHGLLVACNSKRPVTASCI